MISSLLDVAAHRWWVVALRGVIAIIVGLCAFFAPRFALTFFIILFGLFFIVDGVLSCVASFQERHYTNEWWSWLFEGIVSIAIGLFTVIVPHVTAVLLLYFVAGWAVVTGVLKILTAIRHKVPAEENWTLGLVGVLSIIFGLILSIRPTAGILTLLWIVGTFSIISGVAAILISLRLRSLKTHLQEMPLEQQQRHDFTL